MTDPTALLALLRKQRDELLAELTEIDAALQRAAEGRYGYCSRCGQPIDAERLAGRPATSWCRNCKRDYELRRGFA